MSRFRLYSDEERRVRRNEASKRWRLSHPEHYKAATRRRNKARYESSKGKIRIYQAEWVAKNRDRYLAYMKAYNAARKEKLNLYQRERYRKKFQEIRLKSKQYREKNRDIINARTAQWRKKNAEKAKLGQKAYLENGGMARRKFRRDTVPHVKISSCCRTRIVTALKLCGLKKSESAERLLGCSASFMKDFLEHQFRGGMTWDNWGEEWEIDHIIPISKFDLSDKNQRCAAFHYSNCRPLEKIKNRMKSDSCPGPHQALLI